MCNCHKNWNLSTRGIHTCDDPATDEDWKIALNEECGRHRMTIDELTAQRDELAGALNACHAALTHHPGGDNRSAEDIERTRAALKAGF